MSELAKRLFSIAEIKAVGGIDTEKLTYDGLEHAVGNLAACQALVRFNELYDKKHGSYIDNAIVTNSDEHMKRYSTQRHKAWNRYAMFVLYNWEQRQVFGREPNYHHRAQENKTKRYHTACGVDPHKFP